MAGDLMPNKKTKDFVMKSYALLTWLELLELIYEIFWPQLLMWFENLPEVSLERKVPRKKQTWRHDLGFPKSRYSQ